MPSRIPTVRVAPTAAFAVTCSHCPKVRILCGDRAAADQAARDHQNQHAGGRA